MRDRYKKINKLLKEGLSDTEVSRRLGISRPTVQRYRWLSELPEWIRDHFFAKRFAQRWIFDLWTVRHSDETLRETYKNVPQRSFSLARMRTIGEVRKALLNKDFDRRTLLWVLHTY